MVFRPLRDGRDKPYGTIRRILTAETDFLYIRGGLETLSDQESRLPNKTPRGKPRGIRP